MPSDLKDVIIIINIIITIVITIIITEQNSEWLK